MLVIKCVLLLFCYHQLLGGAVCEFTPTVYTTTSALQCDQNDPLQDERLIEILKQVKMRILPPSCKSINDADPSSSSGYYNISIGNGSVVQVYCDMEGTNCGGEGGWTRLAYINMTQVGANCPVGLNQRSFNSKSYCGNTQSGLLRCIGTMFPTLVEYSRVCGRVRGYQYGSPVAFFSYAVDSNLTIDDNYVDGVSITYGSAPRKHLWTYTAAPRDDIMQYSNFDCPCKKNSTTNVPAFVGTDYYCESGVESCCLNSVFSDEPLWDRQQCGGEALCCTHSNMPWFIKTLNETTTEDIELRLCRNFVYFSIYNTDIPLDLIEIFVQ